MPVDVDSTTDPGEASERLLPFLHTDPVRHNVLCTLLGDRVSTGTPVRCWWAQDRSAPNEVLGVAFQSPGRRAQRPRLDHVTASAASSASADRPKRHT